jgi:hypothetical protein
MKVITQLVKHFWERGALTATEIDYLVKHGFVRSRDLVGYGPPPEEPEPEPLSIIGPVTSGGPHDDVEDVLVRRRVRRGRVQPRGQILDEKELCRRVHLELTRRQAALAKLVTVACGVRGNDWQPAAQALRQSPARLLENLARGLRRGAITLRETWQALDMEPLHRLIDDGEARGRAARAYLALLVSDLSVGLGKYTWILKHDEIQAVSNLRVAHGHFIAALNLLYRQHLRLLTTSLARGADPVVVWGLLLLHNAHRSRLDPRDSKFVPDYGPISPPGEEMWQQAWTIALGMDRPRLTKFLVLCYQDDASRENRPTDALVRELYCPDGWKVPANDKRTIA